MLKTYVPKQKNLKLHTVCYIRVLIATSQLKKKHQKLVPLLQNLLKQDQKIFNFGATKLSELNNLNALFITNGLINQEPNTKRAVTRKSQNIVNFGANKLSESNNYMHCSSQIKSEVR